MIGPKTEDNWLGIVCDATSATLLAARGSGPTAVLDARHYFEFDPARLNQHGRLAVLEEFVTEQNLAGCAVYVAFAGAGTVVQALHVPPLSRRNRERAVRTRLMNCTDGRELTIALRPEPGPSEKDGVKLLAAGITRDLSASIWRACRRAGLHVRAMTALAGTIQAPTSAGAVVQLLLGERTTTIQLFTDGRLRACRDVLLGRRDFVAAYQRPILTETGAVTLSEAEAEESLRDIGIPVGREDEIRPGVCATQLWPTLTPVLQRLREEVSQSWTQSDLSETHDAALDVLGVPALHGLGEFLAEELQLRGPLRTPAQGAAAYLAAICSPGSKGQLLDLRPPREQLAEHWTRPALIIGACALLVMCANMAAPREAAARLHALQPVGARLQAQLEHAQQQRAATEQACHELAGQMRCRLQLEEALPPDIPVLEVLKDLFRSVPPGVELVEVRFQPTDGIQARAAYQGGDAASVVATRWVRDLSENGLFSSAKVLGVSGSGRADPAVLEIQAQLW